MKNRPEYEDYYLALAFVVSRRSFDPSSKVGAVIVSKEGRILSTGYNGPIRGSNDEEIPLQRPQKYYHMIHAEENAILAYNGSYQDIQGATIYVTNRPCHKCLRMIIQKGISKIVIGPCTEATVDEEDRKAQEIMLKGREINIINRNIDNIEKILLDTVQYIKEKTK